MDRRFLLFAVLYLWTIKQSSAVDFNITLNRTLLSSMGELNIVRLSSGRLYCLPGQEDWNVFVVPANAFNSCTTDTTGFKSIGSCSNPYLNIAIITTAIELPGIPSFVSGNAYYFSAYRVSAGQIVSNVPCLDGYKFSFEVVEQLATDSSMATSSAALPQPPSSSIVQSLEMSISSSIYSSFASSMYPMETSNIPTFSTAAESATVRPRPSSSTASNIRNTRPITTVTTMTTSMNARDNIIPTTMSINIGRTETDTVNTATITGVGAGIGFIVIVIVVVAFVVLLVACVLVTRNRRELRQNMIYDAHRGSQEKPVATLERSLLQNEKGGNEIVTPLPPYDLYDSMKVPTTSFNTLDNANNVGSTSPVMFSQDSIQSATSMDPLLAGSPPVSPNKCKGEAPSPSQLHSIPEDNQQKLESSTSENDVGNGNRPETYSDFV